MRAPRSKQAGDFRPALLLALLASAAVAAVILSGSPGLPMLGLPIPAAISGSEPMQMAGRSAGITSTIASQEKLAHVAGKTVTVEIVEFPPLAFAPEHHHAGSVTVYVLSGIVRSQIAGQPVMDYPCRAILLRAGGCRASVRRKSQRHGAGEIHGDPYRR